MRYAVVNHFLSPFRHRSATAIPHHQEAWHQMPGMFGVERPIKRNRSPKLEQISSGHKPALRTVPAWPPGHNQRTAETVAELPCLASPCTMKCCQGLLTTCGLGFTPHIQRKTRTDLRLRPHPVDTLLHLAIAPVTPLHGIRGGGQQLV